MKYTKYNGLMAANNSMRTIAKRRGVPVETVVGEMYEITREKFGL